jgi:hypothetical protein
MKPNKHRNKLVVFGRKGGMSFYSICQGLGRDVSWRRNLKLIFDRDKDKYLLPCEKDKITYEPIKEEPVQSATPSTFHVDKKYKTEKPFEK